MATEIEHRPDSVTPTESGGLSISAVDVDWFAEEELIRVIPRNQKRFHIHKDRVIRILQLADEADKQLELLIERLGEWTAEHSEKVLTAYLTLRDGRLAFLAISRDAACDDELEDAISDLDLEIANDPDLSAIEMNTLVLPPASPEALISFFDDRFLLVYRGVRD